MKSVLFTGDINVDVLMGGLASLPVVDKEIICTSFDVAVGSSAAICACAYASLGGNSSFLGLAGEDDYGQFMLRSMNELGVQTKRVRRTSAVHTGVTVNLSYQSTRTQITYPGTISAFDGADVGGDDLRGINHLHFAGPYLQTHFRPHLGRLLKLARQMGISTSLDPQWDPSEKWEFMDQWLGDLDYLFVNEGEAMSIAGAASVGKAAQILAGRTRCAVVKAGSAGSVVYCGGVLHRGKARKVKVIDTTGAGDCFDAAFLYATLEKNFPLPEALRLAGACGSRSCTFAGGVAHRSTYQDLLDFLAQPELS
jgi:sugar/nucleoside kinase (ribokinase family)